MDESTLPRLNLTENALRKRIVVWILLLGLGFFVISFVLDFTRNAANGTLNEYWFPEWVDNLFLNLGTEALGVVIAFVYVESILSRYRDLNAEKTTRQQLREDMLFRLKSRVNSEVIRAIEELRRHDWLTDGTLNNFQIENANMTAVDLSHANIKQIRLVGVTGTAARFYGSDMEECGIIGSIFNNAQFSGAKLANAKLQFNEFKGADFGQADLRGVNFSYSDLTGAKFKIYVWTKASNRWAWQHAMFDETTILPDGSTWTPDIDLEQFTDPHHPHYQQTYSIQPT